MADVLLETVWWIWAVRVWLRARRRASFSGFGGTGGTGIEGCELVWEGSVTSRESSRRLGMGLGGAGAGWGGAGGCWYCG
jgi:hypothetical protein